MRPALTDDPQWLTEASETFRAARALTAADGVVTRVLRLFDAIAAADETEILTPIRPVAAGET